MSTTTPTDPTAAPAPPPGWVWPDDDLGTGVREVDWRSAVSRAYYAAFHTARDLLRRCGFVVPRADRAHAYLQMRLFNSGHLDVSQAGNHLETLRRARNVADYDLGV